MTTRDELLELLIEMSHRHEKKDDEIEMADYLRASKSSKSTSFRHLKELEAEGVLISRSIPHGSSTHKFYRLNPDYQGEVPQKFADLFSKNGHKPPQKSK